MRTFPFSIGLFFSLNTVAKNTSIQIKWTFIFCNKCNLGVSAMAKYGILTYS